MNYIATAEDLVNIVPNADTIWYWDETGQGFVGHPKGTSINNFSAFEGYPYFVNVTQDATWTVETLKGAISANPTKGGIPLEVQFSAIVSGGVPPYSYSWDINGDGTIDDTRQSFNSIYQVYGIYIVTLKVTDSVGNTVSSVVVISALSAPTVIASANPTTGGIPLNVQFSCTVNDPDGTIVLYEWDFDGDGTYNWSNTNTCSTSYRYETKGLYKASIRVTDNDGLTGTDSITITVGLPPAATASADHLTGAAPLNVNFTGTGTDSDGSIVLYEWDFDGDGTYDWSSTTTGNTTYTYTSSGIFNATLRVTDNDGLIDTDSVLISVLGPPISLPGAYPTSGNVPLKVTFFADGDDFDGSPEYYDWDYNGDGVYDNHLIASMNSTYTYNNAGAYNAVLKVTDNDGFTHTASVTITVTDPNPQGNPTASAIASPSNGGAPLIVALSGSGTDPNGTIAKYEWDFEGDGVYDWQEQGKQSGPVGLLIDIGSYSKPVFVDIDNDGDKDLFVGEYYGTVYFYRNDGSNTSPTWTSIGQIKDSTGTSIDVGSYSSPAFVDIDNDGDIDMFIGESGGTIYYYRNDGSSAAPSWTSIGQIKNSAGATIDVGYYTSPSFVDIDNDSDIDMFIGESNGTVYYYRNDGNNTSPIWTSLGQIKNSAGTIIDVGSYSSPAFVDIDNDGDFDTFIGEYYGTIYYYSNDGNNTSPTWTSIGQIKDSVGTTIDVGSYSSPAFADIDNDGDFDMFIGESGGRIYYYRNDGSSAAPVWTAVGWLINSTGGTIDVGSYISPVFVDIDNDGDLDMFIGEYYGTIYYYSNDGNNASPTWTSIGQIKNSTGATIDVGYYASPAFADIDNDGDFDMFIGEYYGTLYYYSNDGNNTSPTWTSIGQINDSTGTKIDIGDNNTPEFLDIDNDGDFDMFIGELGGRIYYYRNDGNNTAPVWTKVAWITDLGGSAIDIGSNSSPAFVDIDNDGDLDMFVGESNGTIYYYRNDGNNTSPIWTSIGQIKNSAGTTIDVGSYSSPVFVDIDSDGDIDMFVGEYYGTIYYYRNDGNAVLPVWTLVTSSYNSIDQSYYSKPVFTDADGDGDYDMFVGEQNGMIYYYPLHGFVTHIYATPGTYNATFRVTDNSGLTDTDSVMINVYDTGSPSAFASAKPQTGDAPLTVAFTGTGTDQDGNITLYEWDFDGDGTYDWSNTVSGNTTYIYRKTGTFNATLRITDNDGKKATDSTAISVSLAITSTRTGIFNPTMGQTGNITTTLSGDSVITIKIIDENGNVIRTLVSNASRTAGAYTDTWDGKDDAGNIVRDGVYYYILEYVIDGQTYVYDLRQKATYSEITPSRTWPTTFNPYEDDFMESSFSIAKPSEVSMYLWRRNYSRPGSSIEPVRTLFTRELKGAGSHTEIWDGVDDNGIVAGPWSGGYPITLWVYELSDNAIIITGNTPVITNVAAEPNYFSPAYNPYGSQPTQYTSVSFNLSKTASVEVKVISFEGLVIRTISKPNLPGGANTLMWDGKDFNDNLVKEGSYSIEIVAIDSDGNRSLPRYAAVIVHY